MNWQQRRICIPLLFGLGGTAGGLILQGLNPYFPALPAPYSGYFVGWWLAALAGYFLLSPHGSLPMNFTERAKHCLRFGLAGTVAAVLFHFLRPQAIEPSLVLIMTVWWTCGILAILVFPYITPDKPSD